jgi:hypothetical protein
MSNSNSTDQFKLIKGGRFLPLANFFVTVCYCTFIYRYFSFDFGCSYLLPKFEGFASQYRQEDICQANNYLLSALAVFAISNLVCIICVRVMNRRFNIPRSERVYNTELLNAVFLVLLGLSLPLFGFVFSDLSFWKSRINHGAVEVLSIYISREMMGFGIIVGFCESCLLAFYLPMKYLNAERNAYAAEKLKNYRQAKFYGGRK